MQHAFSMQMTSMHIRIEDLLLCHREVTQKKVGRYAMMHKEGREVEPVTVTYCVHTGRYHLDDGHHKLVARHLLGYPSILAEVEPCYLYNCRGMEQTESYSIRHRVIEKRQSRKPDLPAISEESSAFNALQPNC